MIWKDYSALDGSHSFLSPSRYHWINYSDEKLKAVYANHQRTVMGTRFHLYAAESIRLGQRLPDTAASLNCFVNDAIGFNMEPEKVLFYSDNCFGTADAISYHEEILRIHDLKTGVTTASMNQLMVYAGIFCLQYDTIPKAIYLRIYQSGEVVKYDPDYGDVLAIMKIIKRFNELIEVMKADGVV